MPEYEPIVLRYFLEPISVSARYHATVADRPALVAESIDRQARQAAEARAAVERLLASALGES